MTDKALVIKLKLDKATALMNEVEILLENHFYTTAISRLYYSCFHATRALLLTKDLMTKTHSGVIALLHKQFVQEGNFDESQAAFLSRLMKERIEGDYNDFIINNIAEIEAYIIPAKNYLTYVISLIDAPSIK